MNIKLSITHKVQVHIIDVLTHQKYARFRDMRPDNCDTNRYSYHLKVLQREGFVAKLEAGYTLDKKGLRYIESARAVDAQLQPKVIIMFVIQNSDGSVLLQQQKSQPFIETWGLPSGALHISDLTLELAATQRAQEILGVEGIKPRHAGDCYRRVIDSKSVAMSALIHVFRFESDTVQLNSQLVWARPHKLSQFDLSPAVEAIITRSFFNDPYFFEEYSDELAS